MYMYTTYINVYNVYSLQMTSFNGLMRWRISALTL